MAWPTLCSEVARRPPAAWSHRSADGTRRVSNIGCVTGRLPHGSCAVGAESAAEG
jgi:hypothetical protein